MSTSDETVPEHLTAQAEADDLPPEVRSFLLSKKFLIPAALSLLITVTCVLIWAFRPGLAYTITSDAIVDLAGEEYTRKLEALADAAVHPDSDIEVFIDGPAFYEAELTAIRMAEKNINLEVYIYRAGAIGDEIRDALVERARAGVVVNVVVDAVGSSSLPRGYFDALVEAGGRFAVYHPPRWHNIDRINNRTHRNLLIVDGRIGFTGGAGVADWWAASSEDQPMWHDSMVRIEGEAVGGLQSTFLENWLESTGQILNPEDYFRLDHPTGDTSLMVVDSSPSAGGSTRARMVFQTMIASARKRIWITTPYFIPDSGVRRALIDAVKRGVDVQVITPGPHTDQKLVQATGRQLYGELINGGVEIYEYQPRMLHKKGMLIDGVWSVSGTTNFDPRSFGLNDEVNVLARSERLARRLEEDFVADREQSTLWTREVWETRGLVTRALGWVGLLFQRQQ